jgi:glycosyltransferase involved in cell wall biosynthesis
LNHYKTISLITPTYNSEKYLEETILSVINQNYPCIEYIIIDGGSTDGTIDIIKKYESHLAWWISEPDKGMYHAIMKGFAKSTGEIMTWLNSDDLYFAGCFRTVSQVFSDIENIEWITGMPATYNKNGLCIKVHNNARWSASKIQAGDYRWIQQESIFWKRSLWQKSGAFLNTKYKLAADFELWCRFFRQTELHSISAPLSGFRIHGQQLSLLNSEEYEQEALDILQSFQPDASNKKRVKKIKDLYNLSNYFKKFNFKFLKAIAVSLDILIEKMYRLPSMIYFDFEENKWKKK